LFFFLCTVEAEQPECLRVTVVIDVFRAFSTASYVLERNPATYVFATKSAVISRLASNFPSPLLIGKPEIGSELIYDIPNSPTRVYDVIITNQNILHRTEAGSKGVLLAKEADIVLVAGFVNAEATAQYINTLSNKEVSIVPMGHEGITPSLEDDLCAMYIEMLINGKKMDVTPYLEELRKGSGHYFFGEDQWQYPREDFERCLEIGRFDFAIRAVVFEDYAMLYPLKMISWIESEVIQRGNLESLDLSSEEY
jgi:2-phosphosulfolactate phosphatase